MKLPLFKLEEFWKEYEFSSPYLLCASDAETWSLQELLALSDPESKKMWEEQSFGYTEVPGHPLLREEISKLYSSIQPDQVLTVAGGEEGIYLAMQTLVSKGDHVIVINPCYQSLKALCEAHGAELSTIQLNPKNRWKLPIEDLRDAFRTSTKLLVINYPHNPSGSLLEPEVFEEMIQLARKHSAYIFSDEMYRFFEVDEHKRLPSIADAYEKGIALFGMTKPFGLAGLRIGWLVSQDQHILTQAANYKVYTSICNSAPSELLAIMALRAKDAILVRNREIMLHNLKTLDAFMERNSNKIAYVRPESGTMAMIELLLPIDIETFAKDLLEKEGVLIMPGNLVDFLGNFFRIGFGRKNFPEALTRLERYLHAV